MAKLVFPSVNAPYRGFVGEVRGWFNRIASFAEKSPDAKAVINTQLGVLATDLGFVQPIATNQRTLTSGVKVTAPAITGTYVNGYTFTIVGGNITAIVAS